MSESPDCERCDGTGFSASYRLIARHLRPLFYECRLDTTTAKITGYLAGRPPDAMLGHDCLDATAAIRKLGVLAGLPADWDACEVCHGSGEEPSGR